MADDDGKMSREQLQKILDWFSSRTKKGEGIVCPVCGGIMFNIQPHLGIVPLFKDGTTSLGTGYPSVVAICAKCANMLFFSAMLMGLLTNEEGQSDAK